MLRWRDLWFADDDEEGAIVPYHLVDKTRETTLQDVADDMRKVFDTSAVDLLNGTFRVLAEVLALPGWDGIEVLLDNFIEEADEKPIKSSISRTL